MTWERHPSPEKALWLGIQDGVAIETLHWDYDKNQYVNTAGIPCGANWFVAKAAAEESAAKTKKAGVR